IDHTAIGIANTEASLHFYRDLLGFRKAGESENFGTEQEHLNQVFGAHLQITGMRPASGAGIEFLEYLTPRDGRARPADVHANDIVHWQTMITTDDVDLTAKKLRDAHMHFVSPGVVFMPKDKAGFSKGALVSDPSSRSTGTKLWIMRAPPNGPADTPQTPTALWMYSFRFVSSTCFSSPGKR